MVIFYLLKGTVRPATLTASQQLQQQQEKQATASTSQQLAVSALLPGNNSELTLNINVYNPTVIHNYDG